MKRSSLSELQRENRARPSQQVRFLLTKHGIIAYDTEHTLEHWAAFACEAEEGARELSPEPPEGD